MGDPTELISEAERALREALRLLALADPQCKTGPRGWLHVVAAECAEAIEIAQSTAKEEQNMSNETQPSQSDLDLAYNTGYNDHWSALWEDKDGHNNTYPVDSPLWDAYERGYKQAGEDW